MPPSNRVSLKEYGPNHWYDGPEISTILDAEAKTPLSEVQTVTSNGQTTALLAASSPAPGDLDVLIAYKKDHLEVNHVVMPFVVSGHWVVIDVNFNADNPAVTLFDPKEDSAYIPETLKQFAKNCGQACSENGLIAEGKTFASSYQGLDVQNDGHNCGPWVVEISKMLMSGNDGYWKAGGAEEKAQWVRGEIHRQAGGDSIEKRRDWIEWKRAEQQAAYAPVIEQIIRSRNATAAEAAAVDAKKQSARKPTAAETSTVSFGDNPKDPSYCFSFFSTIPISFPDDFFGTGIPKTKMTLKNALEVMKYKYCQEPPVDSAHWTAEVKSVIEQINQREENDVTIRVGARFHRQREAYTAGDSREIFSLNLEQYEKGQFDDMAKLFALRAEQDPYLLARLDELNREGKTLSYQTPDNFWGRGVDGQGANMMSVLWDDAYKLVNKEVTRPQDKDRIDPLLLVQAMIEWGQSKGFDRALVETKGETFASTTKESPAWQDVVKVISLYGKNSAEATIEALKIIRLPFGLEDKRAEMLHDIFGCKSGETLEAKLKELKGASAESLNELFSGEKAIQTFRQQPFEKATLEKFKAENPAASRWMSQAQTLSVMQMLLKTNAEIPMAFGSDLPFMGHLIGLVASLGSMEVSREPIKNAVIEALKKSFGSEQPLETAKKAFEEELKKIETFKGEEDRQKAVEAFQQMLNSEEQKKTFLALCELNKTLLMQKANREGVEAAIAEAFKDNVQRKLYFRRCLDALEQGNPEAFSIHALQQLTELPNRLDSARERMRKQIEEAGLLSSRALSSSAERRKVTVDVSAVGDSPSRDIFAKAVRATLGTPVIHYKSDPSSGEDYVAVVKLNAKEDSPRFEYHSSENLYKVDTHFLGGGSLDKKTGTGLTHLFRHVAETAAASGNEKMSLDRLAVKKADDSIDYAKCDPRTFLKAYRAVSQTRYEKGGATKTMQVDDTPVKRAMMGAKLNQFGDDQSQALLDSCRARMDELLKENSLTRTDVAEMRTKSQENPALSAWLKDDKVSRLLLAEPREDKTTKASLTLQDVADVMTAFKEKKVDLAKAVKAHKENPAPKAAVPLSEAAKP